MKPHVRLLTLSLMAVIPPFAYAQEVGTLSVFMFKDGKPLAKNEIVIDAKKTLHTDGDGSAKITLSVGEHQIEIFGKGINGKNLGYFKKPITIKEDKDTQVVASFTMDEPEINIDTPVGDMKSDAQKEKELKAKGTGILNGRVVTSDKGLPIVGARVFVKGTSIDARTDDNGRFSVKIPANSDVSISVVHSAYSAKTISQIQVEKGGSVSRQVELTPASLELEEFVVLAPKIEGSIADVIQEEKNMNAVANILGSADMSKKGDSDAASALKRVSGITLIGGKSIFVRGLGERYSNVDMNSMPLPSPDPLKRVVPLDIFPASAIGSMKVQKSASADIPAAFGGGYIDIRTKDKKDDDFFKISLGLNGSSYTGDSVLNYKGSNTDYLGFDDGYRDIPSALSNFAQVEVGERVNIVSSTTFEEQELHEYTQDFLDRDLGLENEKLPLGYSIGLEGLQNYTLFDDHQLTAYANYNYGQKHKYYKEEVIGTVTDEATGENSIGVVGSKEQTNNAYTHDAFFNLSYNYLDLFKLRYTKLFSYEGDKNSKFVDGIFGSNAYHYQYTDLSWEERTMNVDQINGEFLYQLFNLDNLFSFGLEHATAKLYQPNDFRYRTIVEDNGLAYFERGKSANFLAKKIQSDDTQFASYLNNTLYPNFFDEKDEINFGVSYSSKTREAYTQQFYLKQINTSDILAHEQSIENVDTYLDQYIRDISSPDNSAYSVRSFFGPADYYDAEVSNLATYLGTTLNPYESLSFNVGVRYVNLTQAIYQYEENKFNRNIVERVKTEFDVNDVYPSISIKYKLSDKNQFDLALSKTYITPDLREFSDGQFRHPNEIALIEGNNELVPTQIYNFDLKYSHFMSDTEFIKVGTFYKFLDKPIEDTAVLTTSLDKYSFINSKSATLYGVEFDGRKDFGFLENTPIDASRYIGDVNNYYISGNISYTNSAVELTEDQKTKLTTVDRQLQGLSPLVLNTTFGYDSQERSVTISYNKMGERLRKVGLIDAGSALPDLYEVPPTLVDLVWIEKFDNGLEIKAKAGNILDSKIDWERDDKVVQSYKTGTTYGISASYKF